ncbi:glycolate oxidase FAD binding subunit [Rhodoblastus acidophilus]|uniref:Glycolate oxidase FAD binding subunit n=1 Tax=Rhodoblastus acidophilus TaxID=1074 RepID=A0A212PYG9_RHOAC|nr:glycolate oxidase subunit GlcE [Rhodoblastus acidophilus]PPQ38725.1 glycolate oxidase subunit GlcE [Rhodoblastus acidophilus]RAI21179.1 glycolate oxidase subunit GlcE [Rhodoblastus acidophilus]SNB52117.1 glycolate oxidase FAD binding subunit [Rhodoblastus acidophilus]
MTLHRPHDAREIAEIVRHAGAENHTLEIVAGGSKRAFGRPVRAAQQLNLSKLAGLVSYEPRELVLTARPGAPLADIDEALRAEGQMLAFEPPQWLNLLGGAGTPTLGGVLACNLSGPRRLRAGAARDFILGFSAVNGRGEMFKAGGKVVKNVTGFDLSKLMVGSFGALAILTEVTLKVAPRPETQCTLLLPGLSDAKAFDVMARALNTPHEISAAAHLPELSARRAHLAAEGPLTALRLEGPAPSVAYRAAETEKLFGGGVRLEAEASALFWREVAEVRALLPDGAPLVWRACPTPSRAAAIVAAVREKLPGAEAFYEWGGGLVWLSLDPAEAGPDCGAAVVRGALDGQGHATLVVAPETARASVEVFQPVEPALAALEARVKAGFDPLGLFNPGRMREGV